MSGATCFGLGSPVGCLSLVNTTVNNAQAVADTLLSSLFPAPTPPPAPTPTPPSNLDGRWAGLTPSNGIRFDSAARCSVDGTLDMSQSGSALSGTVTVGRASTASGNGPCTEAFLYSLSAQQELSQSSIVAGSFTNGRVALTAYFRDSPPTSSAAGRARALVMTGTASGARLELSGNFYDTRAWTDVNRNGIPDCDFQNPAANGECAGQGSAPTLRMTLTALRQ